MAETHYGVDIIQRIQPPFYDDKEGNIRWGKLLIIGQAIGVNIVLKHTRRLALLQHF